MEKISSMLHRRLRPTRRLLFFFIFVCFFWMLYVIKIQLEFQTQHINEDYLRRKIIDLSKEYVRVVADKKEKVFGIDGQRTVELQDKEQPIAILLQNLLGRLHTLEERVEISIAQNSQDFSGLLKEVDSLKKAITFNLNSHDLFVQHCKVPNDSNYPNCASKVKWLEEHWKSDIKFSKNGVTGSLCSFLHYLSEVEDFCPRSQKYIKSKDCIVPSEQDFPQCREKVKWILRHWRTDVKFSSNGVNGSLCSILRYLSEVETWCPLLPGRQKAHKDDCKVPQDKAFPNCAAKVAWMKSSWKTDRCYAQDYGVNGTICSFLSYLSEVESWCPTFSGRRSVREEEAGNSGEKVNIRDTSMAKLLDKLTRVVAESRLSWIRSRVAFMYSYWVNGLKELQARVNVTDKAIKKVVIHIGVLAEENKFHFAQTAGKGGPLGELVQWSDLITSLFVLGHDIRVTVDHMELLSALDVNVARSCPPKGGHKSLDLIFIDYYGLQFLKKKARGMMELYRCRLRIVDSFGTEAQFNHGGQLPRYASNLKDIRGITNALGKNNFNLKQYMTMFPHSPDNTFLGFVVDSKTNVPKSIDKKPKALAYGKHYYMWRDLKNRAFLDVIHEHFEIHATTGGLPLNAVKAYLPNYVINHGVLTPHGVQQLLQESKIFIGLGFPYEGPAPLEAIAQGCFFINPKFNPPKNRANTIFFRGKPTFRSLTSQHPYAEEFIGEPRVLTVDINDLNAVKTAVKTILDSQSSPYLPFEYTHEGMLERVNALVHNLDVCNRDSKWPPLTSRKVFSGKDGQSCKEVCLEKGLICEPAYFESINNQQFLTKSTFPCKGDSTVTRPSLIAPAYVGQEKLCVLQANPALYSCTMSYSSIQRVCPCRDYRKGQVALCKTCY